MFILGDFVRPRITADSSDSLNLQRSSDAWLPAGETNGVVPGAWALALVVRIWRFGGASVSSRMGPSGFSRVVAWPIAGAVLSAARRIAPAIGGNLLPWTAALARMKRGWASVGISGCMTTVRTMRFRSFRDELSLNGDSVERPQEEQPDVSRKIRRNLGIYGPAWMTQPQIVWVSPRKRRNPAHTFMRCAAHGFRRPLFL